MKRLFFILKTTLIISISIHAQLPDSVQWKNWEEFMLANLGESEGGQPIWPLSKRGCAKFARPIEYIN